MARLSSCTQAQAGSCQGSCYPQGQPLEMALVTSGTGDGTGHWYRCPKATPGCPKPPWPASTSSSTHSCPWAWWWHPQHEVGTARAGRGWLSGHHQAPGQTDCKQSRGWPSSRAFRAPCPAVSHCQMCHLGTQSSPRQLQQPVVSARLQRQRGKKRRTSKPMGCVFSKLIIYFPALRWPLPCQSQDVKFSQCIINHIQKEEKQ